MTMHLVCPNDKYPDRPASRNKSHKTFSASAHVSQEWKVNQKGEFQETLNECLDVDHAPDKTDVFNCCTCGAEAEVKE